MSEFIRAEILQAYRSALPDKLGRWLPQFISAELCYNIDVPTLAAICERESLGGEALTPKGPTGTGDHGHGHGLMQIDDRSHGGFLSARFWDGVRLWQDPCFNILFAARLLRWNLNATEDDLPLSIAAYNCGLKRARWVLAQRQSLIIDEATRIRALDSATANGDYVTHVLKLRKQYTPQEVGNA